MLPPGYSVTREGLVFSTRRGKPRLLKQHLNGSGDGYPSVYVYRDGQRWHVAVYRLVAAQYLPPKPKDGRVWHICHKDGDRFNSHADNLYWGTAVENQLDAWRHRRERLAQGKNDASGENIFLRDPIDDDPIPF